MRHNKKDYIVFVFLLVHASGLLASQQPKSSIDLWKSITTLQHYKHERYRLHSSRDDKSLDKQLVIMLNPSEKKTLSLHCSRLDSDTLLLVSAQINKNELITVASSYGAGDHAKQLADVRKIFTDHAVKHSRATVLHCKSDGGIMFFDPAFWIRYQAQLQQIIGATPEMIGYSMIAGQAHRDRDHFECRIDSDAVSWRSAIDNFQEHTL